MMLCSKNVKCLYKVYCKWISKTQFLHKVQYSFFLIKAITNLRLMSKNILKKKNVSSNKVMRSKNINIHVKTLSCVVFFHTCNHVLNPLFNHPYVHHSSFEFNIKVPLSTCTFNFQLIVIVVFIGKKYKSCICLFVIGQTFGNFLLYLDYYFIQRHSHNPLLLSIFISINCSSYMLW